MRHAAQSNLDVVIPPALRAEWHRRRQRNVSGVHVGCEQNAVSLPEDSQEVSTSDCDNWPERFEKANRTQYKIIHFTELKSL